jgi:aminopeptidase-like protein
VKPMNIDTEKLGHEMHALIAELYPICRSITGNGMRQTLKRLQREIPMQMHEVPSGTPVFDWVIPKEWNIRDAYIKDPGGKKIVDFGRSNLHVLNYSTPVRKTVTLQELKEHLFTLHRFDPGAGLSDLWGMLPSRRNGRGGPDFVPRLSPLVGQ